MIRASIDSHLASRGVLPCRLHCAWRSQAPLPRSTRAELRPTLPSGGVHSDRGRRQSQTPWGKDRIFRCASHLDPDLGLPSTHPRPSRHPPDEPILWGRTGCPCPPNHRNAQIWSRGTMSPDDHDTCPASVGRIRPSHGEKFFELRGLLEPRPPRPGINPHVVRSRDL